MKKIFFILSFCFHFVFADAQQTYNDSLLIFIDEYIKNHEVVRGDDKKYLHFFPVNEKYRVTAFFNPAQDSPWFKMATSGLLTPLYRVYGTLTFTIKDTTATLYIYQSQSLMSSEKYKEHLFIPFTDMTSGEQTYEGGRYIDLNIPDIKDGQFIIDFNKAYNPYCAYVSNVYNCPLPPKENQLHIFIEAGEKKYSRSH
jgi:uncharacterized protein (DUF1684 family)